MPEDNHPFAASPAATGASCLIVDDEPAVRQVLSHLMRHEGFDIRLAADGVEAMTSLEARPATLILADVEMPRMNGMELLQAVRRQHPDTAVVMITGNIDVTTAVDALSIGAMDYITKPFQLQEVRARVAQALEKRRLILDNRSYQQHLEERVRAQQRRLEELFVAGIQSLSAALEAKDPYTRGHSARVATYATCIARELEVDPDMRRQIELGGTVHDIGKIGVRESVLRKAGPLTADEYAHIMTHTVIGWRILTPLLGDAPLALNVVRWHHERMDGKGMPDGLVGEQIPLEARIIAVADTIDALTSDRPYRASELTLAQAVEELERNSGTQLDPAIVRAVRACVDRGDLRLIPR